MAADRHAVSAKKSGSCAKGEPGDSRTYSSYSMVKDIVSVSSSFGWSGSNKRVLSEVRICVCGEKVVVEELVGGLDAFDDSRVFLYSPWRETFMPVAGGCRAVIHFGLESSNPS